MVDFSLITVYDGGLVAVSVLCVCLFEPQNVKPMVRDDKIFVVFSVVDFNIFNLLFKEYCLQQIGSLRSYFITADYFIVKVTV